MISREKILELLKQCFSLEEKAIPIYAKHMSNTLFLSEFKKEDQIKIKNILETLKRESEGHMKIYEDLFRKVRGSSEDVY